MRGYAQVPKNMRGICTNTFDFTGIHLAGRREGGPIHPQGQPGSGLVKSLRRNHGHHEHKHAVQHFVDQNQALIAVRSLLLSPVIMN